MLDRSRTTIAKFVVQYLPGPSALLVAAWLRLPEKGDNLEEKRRCLNAVLELDPEIEAASLALPLLDQKRPSS